jgi:hypothetical protein
MARIEQALSLVPVSPVALAGPSSPGQVLAAPADVTKEILDNSM